MAHPITLSEKSIKRVLTKSFGDQEGSLTARMYLNGEDMVSLGQLKTLIRVAYALGFNVGRGKERHGQ